MLNSSSGAVMKILPKVECGRNGKEFVFVRMPDKCNSGVKKEQQFTNSRANSLGEPLSPIFTHYKH